MMQRQPDTRRLASATALVVTGAAVSAAGWVGGGGPGAAAALFAMFAVAAVAIYLWSGHSDRDLPALLGGVGDERQRALDTRATAIAGLVMGAFCGVMALTAIARGQDNPWMLVVLVGAVAYAAALAVLRSRG